MQKGLARSPVSGTRRHSNGAVSAGRGASGNAVRVAPPEQDRDGIVYSKKEPVCVYVRAGVFGVRVEGDILHPPNTHTHRVFPPHSSSQIPF